MDVTPFWQPFQNVMALQRATADRRYDMAQNNAIMDMKRQEFEMWQRQNALAEAKQQAELDQAMREQQMREELASMFTPQQTGGPLMNNGGSYQPLSQTSGQPTQAQLLPLLARMGKTTEVFNALAPREMAIVDGNYVDKYGGGARQIEGFTPTSKYSPEYQAFLDANFDGKNSAEASAAFDRREIAMKRAGATNVNVNTGSKLGPLPQGYMAVPDGRGGYHLARLPGHPDEANELRRRESAARTGKTVIQDLERTLSIGGKAGVFGPPAIVTRNIPGTSTYTAEKMIQSALSNVGFDALQEMRQNSPTGGALGNVSDHEVTRLQQTLGSLDVTQPAPIVRDNIKRIINIYRDTVYGTPEQIRQLRDQGFIDAKRARELSQRYELSFDEFGKPIKKGAPRRGGARPQQGNDLSRAAQEELRRRGLQ